MSDRRATIKKILFGISSIPTLQFIHTNSKMHNTLKLRHSVSRWCFESISLDKLIGICKDIGISSIELLNPDEYKKVKQAGLECAMANGSAMHITQGFNNPDYHPQLIKDYTLLIQEAADNGIKNIICFSGNRRGMKDEEGLHHCAEGIKHCLEVAAKYDVIMHMELLNSKINHHDYMCDHSSWAFKLAELLDSPHFKILYDIYHMQIMEGDVINTMKNHLQYIGHIHTAGVPGRGIFNELQELNYSGICKALHDAGYNGYIGHEFIPHQGSDPKKILKEALYICEKNI